MQYATKLALIMITNYINQFKWLRRHINRNFKIIIKCQKYSTVASHYTDCHKQYLLKLFHERRSKNAVERHRNPRKFPKSIEMFYYHITAPFVKRDPIGSMRFKFTLF